VNEDWLQAIQWLPEDVTLPPSKLDMLRHRYAVAESVRPAFIAEIGVRAGYSAYAMLSAAPQARFLGIDNGDPSYGDPVPSREHAVLLLAPFPGVELVEADSRELDVLPPGIDLLHIDGDHSEEGCLSDLRLAHRSGVRWIMVDDTKLLPAVAKAVRRFEAYEGRKAEWVDDGHYGCAVFDMAG
jgi:hypothetical protein